MGRFVLSCCGLSLALVCATPRADAQGVPAGWYYPPAPYYPAPRPWASPAPAYYSVQPGYGYTPAAYYPPPQTWGNPPAAYFPAAQAWGNAPVLYAAPTILPVSQGTNCPAPVQVVPAPSCAPAPYPVAPTPPPVDTKARSGAGLGENFGLAPPSTTPTPTPTPSAEPRTQPTPSAETAAAETTPEASLDMARAGAGLGESFALSSGTPQMMGDFFGYRAVTRGFTVVSSVSDSSVRNYATVVSQENVSSPILTRAAFKIADNESPMPQDRVYVTYNYFSNVQVPVRSSSSLLFLNPTANNFNGSSGPFVLQSTLPGTLNAPTIAAAPASATAPSLIDAGVGRMAVSQEVLGVEKALLGGRVSVGVRVPFFETTGAAASAGPDLAQNTAFQGTFAQNNTAIQSISNGLGKTDIGDITIILKCVLLDDLQSNNTFLSGGLSVTVPTGSPITLADETRIRSALFQPYLGYLWTFRNFFLEGFTSVVVPTDERDVTILFNDVGLGYQLYRGPRVGLIRSITPVVEAHVTTPLDNRGPNQLVTVPDIVTLTAGLHVGLRERLLLSIGLNVPFTGAQPYDIEGLLQLNFRY